MTTKRKPLAGLIAAALVAAATAQTPAYKLDADLETLKMVDCGYYGSENDMGHKNTIASNIAWSKYATNGNDSAIALMALKFRDSFPQDQAVMIIPTINGDTVRNARFLSDNDTARVYMLFFPSSDSINADTLRLFHPEMGSLALPGINYRPRGVYSVELRRKPAE